MKKVLSITLIIIFSQFNIINVYAGTEEGIDPIDKIPSDFGGGYLLCGSMMREVGEKSRHQLALSGKLMGLCGYGRVIPEYVDAFDEFFFDRDYRKQ